MYSPGCRTSGSVNEAVLWCDRPAAGNFRVGKARRKTARMHAEWRKIARNIKIRIDKVAVRYSRQRTCLSDYYQVTQPLDQRLMAAHCRPRRIEAKVAGDPQIIPTLYRRRTLADSLLRRRSRAAVRTYCKGPPKGAAQETLCSGTGCDGGWLPRHKPDSIFVNLTNNNDFRQSHQPDDRTSREQLPAYWLQYPALLADLRHNHVVWLRRR